MNRQRALGLAVLTLFVFPLIGMLLVNLFTEEHISIMIRSNAPLWQQLLIGSGVGALMGAVAWFISSREFIQRSPRVQQLKVLFRGLRLSLLDCILISVAVGFGEELFFRGALQLLVSAYSGSLFFGIVFTSVFFIAVHGYLSYKDWRISIYGVIMTVFIIFIGFLTEQFGIWTAAAAHAWIDFILLANLEDQPVPTYPEWKEEEE